MRLAKKNEADVPSRVQEIADVRYRYTMGVVDNDNQGRLSLLQESVERPNRFVTARPWQQYLPNTIRVSLHVFGGELPHNRACESGPR
ncbi:hypothetical protein D3C77_420730 [compost metagenome]